MVNPAAVATGPTSVYRLRVELDGTDVWRRIEVPADLTLDALHDLLQVAMGWQDYHLHAFTAPAPAAGQRPPAHDAGFRRFVTEAELTDGFVDEPPPGTAETGVPLTDVLAAAGDTLLYEYDYGDSWEHTITVESVREADGPARARCLDGARACPPEDCGGVPGYEEILDAVARRGDPEVADLLEWADSSGHYDPDHLDLDAVDARMRTVAAATPPLRALLRRLGGAAYDETLRLLAAARLDEPEAVEPDRAAGALRHVSWLLEHVGDAGLPLTAAGYLRPADVTAAAEAMSLSEEWIGALNREVDTVPLLHLRTALQDLGLLRKVKGRLHLTKAGRTVMADPPALWAYLARRLPGTDRHGRADAGLLYLLVTAAGGARAGFLGEAMGALGWVSADGGALEDYQVRSAAGPARDIVERIDRAESPGRRPGLQEARPSLTARAFARAALVLW